MHNKTRFTFNYQKKLRLHITKRWFRFAFRPSSFSLTPSLFSVIAQCRAWATISLFHAVIWFYFYLLQFNSSYCTVMFRCWWSFSVLAFGCVIFFCSFARLRCVVFYILANSPRLDCTRLYLYIGGGWNSKIMYFVSTSRNGTTFGWFK